MGQATELIDTLRQLANPAELPKIRKRLAEDEPAFGLRMRDLFDTAKAHVDMDLAELERLVEHPACEPRMAAFVSWISRPGGSSVLPSARYCASFI